MITNVGVYVEREKLMGVQINTVIVKFNLEISQKNKK